MLMRAAVRRMKIGNHSIVAGRRVVMKSFDDLVSATAQQAMRDDRHLRKLISRIVPADTMAHVRFCRLADQRLRITLDNASWLVRLRFSERQIIDALRSDGQCVDDISWHIDPHPGIDALPRQQAGEPARQHQLARQGLREQPPRMVDSQPGPSSARSTVDPDGEMHTIATRTLKSAAESMPDDELRAALLRIARTLERLKRPGDQST